MQTETVKPLTRAEVYKLLRKHSLPEYRFPYRGYATVIEETQAKQVFISNSPAGELTLREVAL